MADTNRYAMVLVLDGNSEHVVHVRRQTVMKISRIAIAVDLNKCLKLVKLTILLYACAPILNLPSYARTINYAATN